MNSAATSSCHPELASALSAPSDCLILCRLSAKRTSRLCDCLILYFFLPVHFMATNYHKFSKECKRLHVSHRFCPTFTSILALGTRLGEPSHGCKIIIFIM
jgi:hypothetical protein